MSRTRVRGRGPATAPAVVAAAAPPGRDPVDVPAVADAAASAIPQLIDAAITAVVTQRIAAERRGGIVARSADPTMCSPVVDP